MRNYVLRKIALVLVLGLATPALALTKSSYSMTKGATLNVVDYGAVGDGVADDTTAIQATINAAATFTHGAVITFPPGQFKVTTRITVPTDAISLVGENRIGSATLTSGGTAGPELVGATSGMIDVLYVHKPGGIVYGFQIRGIRVSAKAGLALKPNGISLVDVSEFRIENLTAGLNLKSAINLDGVGIGTIESVDVTTSDVGINFTLTRATLTLNSTVWILHTNIWTTSEAAIKFDSSTDNVNIRDSWIEWSPTGILIANSGRLAAVSMVTMESVSYANGSGTPFSDGRFLRVVADPGGTGLGLSVSHIVMRNCRAYVTQVPASPYLIEFTRGTNVAVETGFSKITIDGGRYWGASTALLHSDVSTPGFLLGNVEAQNASFVPVPILAEVGLWTTAFPGALNNALAMSAAESALFQAPSLSSMTLKSQLVAGDTGTDWTLKSGDTSRTAGNFLKLQLSDGTTLITIDNAARFFTAGNAFIGTKASTGLTLEGTQATGSGGAAVLIGNNGALSGSTDDIVRFYPDAITTLRASIDKDGMIKLGIGNASAPPTCAVGVRGKIWYQGGGAGVKDNVQVCAKDGTDAYAWRTIY